MSVLICRIIVAVNLVQNHFGRHNGIRRIVRVVIVALCPASDGMGIFLRMS
jgi:hypothetical protein